MLGHIFRRSREKNDSITANLYSAVVAAARQPKIYADWGVPDTPLGRYEMISLHMVLALRRMKNANQALRDASQDMTDHFFREVDHSLRELGVGDVGVPKRMKKLAKMFYGRAESYGEAIEANDVDALQQALERNVWPAGKKGEAPPEHDSAPLAAYALNAADGLKRATDATLSTGQIRFPDLGSPR